MSKLPNSQRDDSTTLRGSNDHFIPRFLLRNFVDRTAARESEHKIHCVNVQTGWIQHGGVGRTASREHLYDAPRRDAAGMPLDATYRDLENRAAEPLKRLIDGDLELSTEDRATAAMFVAHQATRTPAYRDRFDQMFAAETGPLVAAFLESARRYPQPYRDILEEYAAARTPAQGDGDHIAENAVQMAADAAPLIAAMTWTIIRAPVGSAFVIADTPVFSLRTEAGPLRGPRDAVGDFVQLPLSPDRLLWMERAPSRGTTGEVCAATTSAEMVVSHNRLSVAVADVYVYAASNELAEWAKENRTNVTKVRLPRGWLFTPPSA